jgi:DNA-binding NarL/FixJ family response regulator
MNLHPHTLHTPHAGLPRRKRIAFAIAQPQYADGLRAMVAGEVDMEVVAQATDEATLLRRLEATPADVLVLADPLGSAPIAEVVQRLAQRHPRLAVLVLVEDSPLPTLHSLVQAGAHGLVSLEAGRSELIAALRALYRGQRYVGLSVQQVLFSLLSRPMGAALTYPAQPVHSRLTQREVDILCLLAEGLTSTQIADRLCLSPRTVDTHRKNMLRKTSTNNVAGLIRYGITYGLL